MVDVFWDNIFRADKKQKNISNALKNNVLFQELNSQELKLVQNIVNVRTYRTGEPVFSQGEPGVGMYIIVSGSIDLFVEEAKTVSEEMTRTFVTRLSENSFFGEIALVEETGRRTATAIAHEETTLIGFFKPDLMEIVSRNPTAGVKILFGLSRVLGTRLAETTAQIKLLRRRKATE